MAADPVNGVWKSLTLVLITILIAGAPGMIYALRTWSVADRVDLIQQRQDDVRIRLGVLEAEHRAMLDQLHEIQTELKEHTRPK